MHNNFLDEDRCPPAGTGVHSWILATANRCRNAGLSDVDAERFIAERVARPPKPANEIRVAVAKAYQTSPTIIRSVHYDTLRKSPVPITAIQFDESKLRGVASRITSPPNWRHWLWERSPKRPETQNGFSFLAHLYAPGERVHIFDRMDSLSPLCTLHIGTPTDCRVPSDIVAGGVDGHGIWYLCNPVDGQWHPNPRTENKPSCRSEESLTAFRYAVLESDEAKADLWLAFLVQLPVRIAAIYTSGSRSIHCLIRVDARTKAEWDKLIGPLKRPLKVLGADPACLSAVRLTRLPGCARPTKGGFQQLLYLCPNPPLAPLIDLPVLFPRKEVLAHWRQVCPRWNPHLEAFV